jgi:hypothetical protein
MSIIFEDNHIQVIHAPGPSRFAVVAFNTMDQRANGRNFWGQDIGARYDIEFLGFVSKGPNWYPEASMVAASEVINRLRTKPLIGYGHSMGGYACVKYSRLLGFIGSVSSAPQITIDPENGFGDKRFSSYFDPVLNHDMDIKPRDLSGRNIVFYDPYERNDNWHAHEICKLSKSIEAVCLPHMAHRTVMCLKPRAILLPLFDTICNAGEIQAIIRQARVERKALPQFLIYLGRKLVNKAKFRWAIQILEGIVFPETSNYNKEHMAERGLFLSRAYFAQGMLDKAIEEVQQSIALFPGNASYSN